MGARCRRRDLAGSPSDRSVLRLRRVSLGFAAVARATGAFRIIGAADINETSAATYERNLAAPALRQDVRLLAQDRGVLQEFLAQVDAYDPDLPLVLIGCAPCQGFSAHSKKNWGHNDERNDLIGVLADIVAQLSPTCVIMENVPELLSCATGNASSDSVIDSKPRGMSSSKRYTTQRTTE